MYNQQGGGYIPDTITILLVLIAVTVLLTAIVNAINKLQAAVS